MRLLSGWEMMPDACGTPGKAASSAAVTASDTQSSTGRQICRLGLGVTAMGGPEWRLQDWHARCQHASPRATTRQCSKTSSMTRKLASTQLPHHAMPCSCAVTLVLSPLSYMPG